MDILVEDEDDTRGPCHICNIVSVEIAVNKKGAFPGDLIMIKFVQQNRQLLPVQYRVWSLNA